MSREARIWLEALTPKQALLFSRLAKELGELGFECYITTRTYDYTVDILRSSEVELVVVGEHGGRRREEKLFQSLRRQLKLLEEALKRRPFLHISFTSPDSSRVAFGLGLPVVSLTDSPHSVFVNKLSIPLSDVVVAPRCTKDSWTEQDFPLSKFVFFEGLFEVSWTKGFEPDDSALSRLGLEKYGYAIVRTEEKKASYYEAYASYGEPTKMCPLIDAILGEGLEVVLLPRYLDQERYLRKSYGERIVILKRGTEIQSLEAYAGLVVTGGSTLAVESSLLGTPSITTFPARVDTVQWAMEIGLPLAWTPRIEEAVGLVREIARDPLKHRKDTRELLSALEDPVRVVARLAEDIYERCTSTRKA